MRNAMIGKAGLLAALALSACSPPHPNPRELESGEALLTVAATGKFESKPDQARLSVGVTTPGATAAAASAANATRMTAVIAAIKALGVADADIQTSSINVERQDWGPNKGNYEATNSVQLVVRDVSKAGAVVKAATGAGANVMSGPDLQMGDVEAASRGAAAAAFKAARARADAYAEAAGMKVVRVLAIRDGAAPPSPSPMMFEDKAVANRAPAPPPPIMGGTNTSEVTVGVDFALAPK